MKGDGVRLVILHGYGASPEDHWFQWLADEIDGVEAVVPQLPDPVTEGVAPWLTTASAALGRDGEVVVVGHSLGTLAAVLAIGGIARERVRGIVLVSPFWEALPAVPEIGAALALLPDLRTLVRDTPTVVIASDDDPVVPVAASHRFAEMLGVDVRTVPGAGHFLGGDGWTSLPAARDEVLALLR